MKTLSKLFVPGEVHMKADSDGEFEAYANVKNIVDHAMDVAMDGCYKASIENHRKNNTAPKLLWSHNPYDLPVGVVKDFGEDSKGLLFKGKLSDTSMGKDLRVLAKDGAIDQFSIGYTIQKERWNGEKGYNELIEIDVKEISWVNFACNEESRLQDIKSHMGEGEMPSKRELERFLRDSGLSRAEAKKIASQYNPLVEKTIDKEWLSELQLLQ